MISLIVVVVLHSTLTLLPSNILTITLVFGLLGSNVSGLPPVADDDDRGAGTDDDDGDDNE